MEPNEIWELLVKADDLVKYATEERRAARTAQATELVTRALAEAEAIGDAPLAEQARTRLRDLGAEA
jgi:hypothetical protein